MLVLAKRLPILAHLLAVCAMLVVAAATTGAPTAAGALRVAPTGARMEDPLTACPRPEPRSERACVQVFATTVRQQGVKGTLVWVTYSTLNPDQPVYDDRDGSAFVPGGALRVDAGLTSATLASTKVKVCWPEGPGDSRVVTVAATWTREPGYDETVRLSACDAATGSRLVQHREWATVAGTLDGRAFTVTWDEPTDRTYFWRTERKAC